MYTCSFFTFHFSSMFVHLNCLMFANQLIILYNVHILHYLSNIGVQISIVFVDSTHTAVHTHSIYTQYTIHIQYTVLSTHTVYSTHKVLTQYTVHTTQ